MYTKLASAIYNDIYSGLLGYHHNLSLSLELLEDEIVLMRLQLIKEYQLKGILPIRDLVYAINCINVDCKDLERCPICLKGDKTLNAHFEIPLLITEFGENAILYIGSTDRQNSFNVYILSNYTNNYQKYKRRGKNKPYVYVDPAPNENNMLDCYVFNAPLLNQVSVVAVWKDPRLLSEYGCCSDLDALDNMTFIDNEVKQRLTEQKVRYYRLLAAVPTPNNQAYK